MKSFFRILSLFVLFLFPASCINNNPYRPEEADKNYLYRSFADPPKHLDPARSYVISEAELIAQIYEPPVQYHYLKRPYELIPLTAEKVPQPAYYDKDGRRLSDDPPSEQIARTVYTIHIKPSIFYQNHPAFAKDETGGYVYHHLTEEQMANINDIDDFPLQGTRELTAADYVYQIKRLAHPQLQSPIFSTMAKYILGLDDLAQELAGELERIRTERRKSRGGLYNQESDERDKPILLDLNRFDLPGVRVLDPYTYEVILTQKYPQFVYWLAMPFFAPVPEESDRFFTQAPLVKRNLSLDNRPLGTGPYRMSRYLANREIILARNENFRQAYYPDAGEPGDRDLGLLDDAGKPLPFIDKAIYKLEKETIPRWNKFLQGYYETSGISTEVFDQVVQMNTDGGLDLSPTLQQRGVRLARAVEPSIWYFVFNMQDDIVGGYTPEKQKLRQALSIAIDIEEWIQIFLNGRGIPGQDILPPGIFGHREGKAGTNNFVYTWDETKGARSRQSIEHARQLLAEAGYPDGKDKDGNPLTLYFDTAWTGAAAKPRLDWLRKQFAKLNVDLQIRQTDFNRFQDKVHQGNFQILFWGWIADYPDPENFLFLLYGPNSRVKYGGENISNYSNPVFNRLFKQMESMQNGPERLALITQMTDIARQDASMVWAYHPIAFGLYHKWYVNTKPMTIGLNTLKYQKLDPVLREQRRAAWNDPVWWPVVLIFVILIAGTIPAIVTVWKRERRVDIE